MSFYGNILYELTNAFAEILIKNSGRTSAATISPSSSTVELPAVGLGGRFTLDSGNKWINLSGNADSQLCKIYHSGIDSTNTKYSFTSVGNPESATEATELSPGDYLSGEQIFYDEAGHITGSKQVVYKLPISETEAELIALQEEMATLKESDEAQTKSIEANTKTLTNLETTYGESIETLQADLDAAEDLLGDKIYMTTGTASVTQAIGSLENIQAISTGKTNSVSTALTYLNQEIAKRDNTINDISTSNRYSLEQLIKQLESQLDIEIDESLIWPTATT